MKEFCRENVLEYYISHGPMEKIIPDYKYRSEQAHLTEGIVDAFINQEFLLAEVGTGVGKTFAYLIPAAIWSLQEGEKVVISTRTKALQEQIVGHDIPHLKRIIGQEFKYIEAKGRENYLCWNKYSNILAGRKKLDSGEQEFMTAILGWAEKTMTGDRKEVELGSDIMRYWELLAADRRSCLKDKCRYHDKCFRLKMIRQMEKADLIIVNHALLLSDMLTENSLLPEYHYLVIDEAHTFDRESFDKLSRRFSRLEKNEALQMLCQKDGKNERGYLQYLRRKSPQLSVLLDEAEKFTERALESGEEVFSCLEKGRIGREDGFSQVLHHADLEKTWFKDALLSGREFLDNLRLLLGKLKEIKNEASAPDEDIELNTIVLVLEELADKAFQILEEDLWREEMISWLESAGGRVVAISSSPVRIGEELSRCLYEKLESLIMVSATLTIEDRFDYFIEKSGLGSILAEDRINTLLEKSPFDYDGQAGLCIINDMPEPGQPAYFEEVCGALSEIFKVSGGRTMVLFTSRRHLQEVSSLIRPYCENHGIKLLVQYEDGGFKFLLEEFTSSENAVLMGVETFWEGVDLKGELLKCVVIVRLPFRSPSDPFASAGDKYYRILKKNSFTHFMLPDAAVRFKQGSGRLIRSEDDRGILIVLDSRLEKRPYGKVFKNSIPIKNIFSLRRSEISEAIEEWF